MALGNNEMADISSRIKSIRCELDLTQDQFAKEVGSHVNTVLSWEKNAHAISPEMIEAIDALCERHKTACRLSMYLPEFKRIKREDMAEVIKKIKSIRAALGMTQRDLGKELGITRNKVGWWEQGKHGISARMVESLNAFCLKNGLDIRI